MKTLYDLIGARRDDDAEGLKKAYRQAAKANHPDYHGDDPEAVRRFRRIAAAYDILRDSEQRAAYDRILESRRRPPQAPPRPAAPPWQRRTIAGVGVTAVVTVILSAAFGLLARSGPGGDAAGHRAPPGATAALTPAAPRTPVIVVDPGAAASATRKPVVPELAVQQSTVRDLTALAPATEPASQATSIPESTGNRPASENADVSLPAAPAPAIDLARRDVDMELVTLRSAPDLLSEIPSMPSDAPWLARRRPALDLRLELRPELHRSARTRGPAAAETLLPPKKPALRPGPGRDDALVESAPASLRLGALCLSLDSRGCPAVGDERRR